MTLNNNLQMGLKNDSGQGPCSADESALQQLPGRIDFIIEQISLKHCL